MNDLPPARTGRETQLYSADGVRQVAVAIPIDPSTNKVLVITSSKHANVWVLPKGGWENDETQEECAKRETYEEGETKDALCRNQYILVI
ncbi:hypothetical protein BDB00DRAFT_757454 [Zychaea mexicana]|uniref:uncharacterized protein n=1 Tax=Zychaea mexicana TaxID=64656 RepID=UPI0022FDBD8E|nr:uncharacterized protein BDB00DRAFT_757454 [Zychaea mexicana]KAI9496974.1 hypothetical protein BDB00DRAFT_757454 [Zychaea mexicana]